MEDLAAQFDELLEAFERLGIEVRREALGGRGGGLSTIGDRRVLFVDQEADLATQLDSGVKALAELPETASMYLLPALRERIDQLP